MTLRRHAAALTAVGCVAMVACSAADDTVSIDEVSIDEGAGVPVENEPLPPSDAGSPEPVAATTIVANTVAPSTLPEPESGSDVAANSGGSELAVSVLAPQPVVDGTSSPIVLAVDRARQAASDPGALASTLATSIAFGGGDPIDEEGAVTFEFDESFAPGVDLFIGAVSTEFVGAVTDLAASREVPLVIVDHVATIDDDRRGVRLDVAGSVDLELRAVTTAVVRGEHDGILIVGASDDPNTTTAEQLFFEVGADPVVLDASLEPSASAIEGVRQQLSSLGERPAVVLVSPSWAVPLVDVLVATGSQAQFFASDLSLSRSDVEALVGFGSDQLVVVRRVDDLRRPELDEFASSFLDAATRDGVSTDVPVSYDAYALAVIAAAASGSADRATIRSAMIEASRGGEVCDLLSECIALASNGIDVDYDGLSGPLDLDDDGVATAAWFSIEVTDPGSRGASSSDFVLQRS
ncbi:MAG: hypothetical protein AB8G14_03155 [Ilumatobacter sp.]